MGERGGRRALPIVQPAVPTPVAALALQPIAPPPRPQGALAPVGHPVGHSAGSNFVGRLVESVHAQHMPGTVIHTTSVVEAKGGSRTVLHIQSQAAIDTPVPPDDVIEIIRHNPHNPQDM